MREHGHADGCSSFRRQFLAVMHHASYSMMVIANWQPLVIVPSRCRTEGGETKSLALWLLICRILTNPLSRVGKKSEVAAEAKLKCHVRRLIFLTVTLLFTRRTDQVVTYPGQLIRGIDHDLFEVCCHPCSSSDGDL